MADEAAIHNQGGDFIMEVWGLCGTAIVFTFLRYYARWKAVGLKGYTADDYLMMLATLVLSLESVTGYMVIAYWKGFANNGVSDSAREMLYNQAIADPTGPAAEELQLREGGSKNHVAGLLTYVTLMWLLKGCWVLYYNRLMEGVGKSRLLIKGSIIVIPGTYIGCLAVAFLKCIPFEHQWQTFPNPGRNCMPAVSPLQTIFVMIMNTVTDFYLMAIPVPIVWTSRLPAKKKCTLIFMFSGAILEMIFGILRAVAILVEGDSHPAQSGYWSIRESFVSHVLTNIPMVYPLFRDYYKWLRGRTGLTSAGNGGTHHDHDGLSYPQNGGSRKMHTSPQSRSHDPYIIPSDITFGDSQEHICVDTCEQSPPKAATLGIRNTGCANGWPLLSKHDSPPPLSQTAVCMAIKNLESGLISSPPQSHYLPNTMGIYENRFGGMNQIVVTTEYTVTGMSKTSGGPNQAF